MGNMEHGLLQRVRDNPITNMTHYGQTVPLNFQRSMKPTLMRAHNLIDHAHALQPIN